MKKLFLSLVTIGLVLSFTSLGYAGNFNFGVGTYEQYDDILVVNSLGDEPSISTFGNLGANDFIPENAFKNTLGYEGYSVAYDYNPTYAGLYSGIYEKALPTGVDLTKIQIGGLAGNPRAKQDVYVLTSEYNRLSAQGQANRIDVNTTNISTLNNNAILYDINRNVTLENNLTVNGNTLINGITLIKGNLDVKGLVDPDALLLVPQTTIPSEEIGTIYYDNGNVNSFMFKDESGWRNYGKELNNHESRLNDLDNRVSDLEKTQYVAEGEFRIYDGKNLTISPFVRQNFSRNKVDTVGIRFTFKLGTSYEEREIAKTNARLDRTEQRLGSLEERLGQPAYIEETKVVNTKGKVISQSFHIQALPEGLIVNKKF